MGSNGVVSIRVEALGVSITIADGSIAIEQTKAEIPAAAVSNAEGATKQQSLPAHIDNSTVRDSGARNSAPVTDEFHRPSPPGSNGPTKIPSDSGEDQETRSSQTKPLWSEEEVEKLKALYPTHSASAITKQLGRSFTAIRSKAQNLGLKKAPPPPVRSAREAKPAPKPKPLSAAATTDSPSALDQNDAAGPGFSSVTLLDHHPGQCRWIISDVWPVMYCGAPVVDSSSWCEQHSRRVFNPWPEGLGASPYRIFRRFR
jgi:hypothetical protein